MHKKRKPIYIEPDDAKLLIDVIDLHVDGVKDAKELTTTDPTVATAEQLCDLVSGYDDDLERLGRIKVQLERVV